MIYTLTLNPAIDYVVQLGEELRRGSLNRSRGEDFQFGGKGINVSSVLKTLGHESVSLGFVAGFTGHALEQGLQQAGLTTRFVHTARGNTRINVKIKESAETEINGSGPVITPEDMARLYGELDALSSGDVLVLSGSVPGCLGADTYARILKRLQGKKILTVVDASRQLLTDTLPYRPFLIKPNRQELEEIFGTALHSDEDLLRCACLLQEKGPRNLLISLAGEGALLLDETGTVHRIQCPRGTVRNSVGAGDSMVAGFLAGWLERGDYAYALRLGTAAGSATAFSLGLACETDIRTLLSQMA